MSAAPRPRKRRPTTRAKPAGKGAKKSGGKPTGRTVRKPAGKPVRKARPAPRTPVAAERAPRVEVRFEVPRSALPMSAAKMRALIRRGLVEGCECGCRGDFVLTDKGRALLALRGGA